MATYEEQVEEFLAHEGVKGMRWGIRKSAPNTTPIKDKTESLTVKLKDGSHLTLDGDRTPGMAKFIARLSPATRERLNNSSSFKLKAPDGTLVGEMQLYKESPKVLNVVWVGVSDDHRGKGYATAAMNAAIYSAKKQNLDKVTLEVPGHSPDALHIYKKLGFKETKQITSKNDIWGGLTKMELDLRR